MARTQFYSDGHGFYQVVKRTKATVTVRPVKSECLGTTTVYTAFDYDVKHRALKDEFTTTWLFDDKQNANGKRCKVDPNGYICLSSYFRVHAYPCEETEIFNRNLG